jgi:hypothetical protein
LGYDKFAGLAIITVIITLVVVEPVELVAVITYEVVVFAKVGIPEICPVKGFNVKPSGKLGVTE